MDRRRPIEKVIETRLGVFRKSQRRTICDLTVGLIGRGRLGLAEIARGMQDGTTVRHRIKRAWRFARNPGVSHHRATGALVDWMSAHPADMVVALDWTDLGDYMLLAAKVAVDRRAVPIAWEVVRKGAFSRRKRSRNHVEEKLIDRLRRVIGSDRWVLVADRGFARVSLFKKLSEWHVRYVIRASGSTWVEGGRFSGLLDNVPRSAGMHRRYKQVRYHKRQRLPVDLVVSHREPAPEPWYLVTNVEATAARIASVYRKRMWIEQSFRDAKSNLGLSRLWLAEPERIARLLILLAIVMLLAILTGRDYRRRYGERDPQLSTKRRGGALSVFRTGLLLLQLHGPPLRLYRLRLFPRTYAL
jgi:hypothetical protein